MTGRAPAPWPGAIAGTPAVAVIERAIERRRLSHSLLLTGGDTEALEQVANAIADRLLNGADARAAFPPAQHPDCFVLRPTGKMRQVTADATRALIGKVQVSAAVSPRKVAILHEVDRMNLAAANIFLKTLEEPPANTTLLLLTSRPYALLPTIRSRVLHFRFPFSAGAVVAEGWTEWRTDYRAWLERLDQGVADRRGAADAVLSAYGLLARFGAVLAAATAAAWEERRKGLPAELEDDEKAAIETGLANGIRLRLFAEVAATTRTFAVERLRSGDEGARRALIGAIDRLEHATGLLRLNLNELAALETVLLASLRLWARR